MAGWQFWRAHATEPLGMDSAQETALRLQERDARLWVSAAIGLSLTSIAFLAAHLPRTPDPLFPEWYIPAERAAPALLGLFLLFHIDLLYRKWQIRREQRRLLGSTAATELADDAIDVPAEDPVTGLATLKAAEEQLGRELALTRRAGEPLSILAIAVEEISAISARYGEAVAGRVLQDFTRQLRRATRGGDFAARTGAGEFLAVLPGCALHDVKRVVERLGRVTADCAGDEVPLRYSTAWVDSQPGESTGEFLKRARLLLRLYKEVEGSAVSSARH